MRGRHVCTIIINVDRFVKGNEKNKYHSDDNHNSSYQNNSNNRTTNLDEEIEAQRADANKEDKWHHCTCFSYSRRSLKVIHMYLYCTHAHTTYTKRYWIWWLSCSSSFIPCQVLSCALSQNQLRNGRKTHRKNDILSTSRQFGSPFHSNLPAMHTPYLRMPNAIRR